MSCSRSDMKEDVSKVFASGEELCIISIDEENGGCEPKYCNDNDGGISVDTNLVGAFIYEINDDLDKCIVQEFHLQHRTPQEVITFIKMFEETTGTK